MPYLHAAKYPSSVKAQHEASWVPRSRVRETAAQMIKTSKVMSDGRGTRCDLGQNIEDRPRRWIGHQGQRGDLVDPNSIELGTDAVEGSSCLGFGRAEGNWEPCLTQEFGSLCESALGHLKGVIDVRLETHYRARSATLFA